MKGDIMINADFKSVAMALPGIPLHTPGFTKKCQENKDICDPLHRSLAKMTHCRINVIFQFPSSNKTGHVYAMQAGDYFKGHPSPSLAFLLIVCDNGAVLSST